MRDITDIKIDDLVGSEIINLLQEHLDDMYAVSPPESVHALDLDELRKSESTFSTIWDGSKLAGCGALKELTADHAEIKSMRTAADIVIVGADGLFKRCSLPKTINLL